MNPTSTEDLAKALTPTPEEQNVVITNPASDDNPGTLTVDTSPFNAQTIVNRLNTMNRHQRRAYLASIRKDVKKYKKKIKLLRAKQAKQEKIDGPPLTGANSDVDSQS